MTLLPVVASISLAVLSCLVIVSMCRVTNLRLERVHAHQEAGEAERKPYQLEPSYFVVGGLLMAVSAICGYVVGTNANSVVAVIELSACYLVALGAAVIDLKLRIIPNYIPVFLIAVRILIFLYEMRFTDTALSYLVSSLIGCFLCFVLLMVANKIAKGGIGGGDIKLLSGVGFMCGVYVVFSSLLLALLCCLVCSLILVALKKKTMKDHTPFGPYIFLGYMIVCLLTLY